MIAEIVYILCAVTSVLCAVLLLRQYRATPNRLLFWSAGCFVCLAASNVLLYVDLVILPNIDLSALRNIIMLVGISMLLTAQTMETQ
jgi:hypothetical protein